MRGLALNWVGTLGELLQWRNNPFLVRQMHRTRRRDPLPLLLGVEALVLALGFAICAAAGVAAQSSGFRAGADGSVGTWCAIVVSLIHLGAASLAARLGGGDWITREAQRGTLDLLLATPMSPLQMVLKHATYPFLTGMLASLVPLPFYALCAALGGPGLLTMLSFYVLVTVLVVSLAGVSRSGGLWRGASRLGVGAVGIQLVGLFLVLVLVINLMAAFWGIGAVANPLAAPLALARWLTRAHVFYSFPLPPLVVLLAVFPLWMGSLAMGWAQRLDFEGRLGVPATRARSALIVLLAFVALGYAWPALVSGGLAASLVEGSDSGAALRGLLLALVTASVLLATVELAAGRTPSGGLLGMLGLMPGEGAGAAVLLRSHVANTLSVLTVPLGLVLAGCLLSWTSPILMGLAFMAKVLVSCAAMVLYVLGVSVFAGSALGGRGSWEVLLNVAWYVLSFALPLLALLQPYVQWDVTRLVVFSPIGGLLDLFAPVRPLARCPWGEAALLHVPLGLLGVLGGWRIWQWRCQRYERAVERARREAEEAARRPRHLLPLGVLMEQDALRLQDHFDNPIAVAEVRRGLRHGWRALPIICSLVAAGWLWILVRSLLRGSSVSTGCPGLAFTQRLSPWQNVLALWAVLVLVVPLVMAISAPLGPAAGTLSRWRRQGRLPFVAITALRPQEIINGLAVAGVYPVALCLVPMLALGLLAAPLSLSPWALLATLTMGLWTAGLAILTTGMALLGASWTGFGSAGETMGGMLAVGVVLAAETTKLILVGIAVSAVASGVGRELTVYLAWWASAVIYGGIGLLSTRLAASGLGRVLRRDIPIPQEPT